MSVGAATLVVPPFAEGDHACKIYPIEVGPGAPAKAFPSLSPPTALPKPAISFSFDHYPVRRGYFAIGHLIYMVGGRRGLILTDVTVYDTVTCSVRQASPMVYPKYDPTVVGPIRGVWDDRDPDVKETWRCFVMGHELTSHDFEALDVQFFHSGREPTSRWTSLPQPPVSRVERSPLLATVTGYRIHSHAIIKDNNVILLATLGEGVSSYHVSESIWTTIECSSPGPGLSPSTRITLPFRNTAIFFGPLGAYIACSPAFYPDIGGADYCAFRPYGPEPECLIAHKGRSAPKGSYDKIPVRDLLTMPLAMIRASHREAKFHANLAEFDSVELSSLVPLKAVFSKLKYNPALQLVKKQKVMELKCRFAGFMMKDWKLFTTEKPRGKHTAEVEESTDLQPKKRARHMEQVMAEVVNLPASTHETPASSPVPHCETAQPSAELYVTYGKFGDLLDCTPLSLDHRIQLLTILALSAAANYP
ncbi:hypothetical protein RJ639_046601 [Escallonia herrerae]|uniref:Uncharacterized protein n=1 Tax=Escallonia herrerae TaxID=1293975 RepID=A0AA88WDW3_9ASTE|nr:hypothetical protein RJ639_046601 [Escallonia herrerae]